MRRPLVSIVEDDQFFRASMARLMRSMGYAVESFASAADFLDSPRFAETDFLIADVHMPLMSGIQLYRHLLYAEQAIPTILVTAYPNEDDRAEALNEGVVCYLPKPIDERILKRYLREALGSDQA
jgi:FixJ family two-component response regulator